MRTPSRPFSLLCALAVLATTACAQLTDQLTNLPKLSRSELQGITLAESSKIYAGDGSLITTLHGPENRTIIPLERIPKHVQDAIIAIEDERFWDHDGVDWQAIARAVVANVASGEIREGGSTITQQYVKNAIIAPGAIAEKTIERKLNEAALARQLETKISKEEILERYLNTVYFGQGAYGIQAAAKTFFGKVASQLNLSQSATLAGIVRSPGQYDPFDNRKASQARRDLVLDKMLELGWITADQAAKTKSKKLKVPSVEQKDKYAAPYFVDYVQRLVTYDPRFEVLGKTTAQRTKQLFQGGLRIFTTVDLDMQDDAEQAVEQVMTEESDPYASLVAIEPDTGEVKAMVGGRDWFAPRKEDRFAKLNLAILAEPDLGCVKAGDECLDQAPGTGRQAGSAFKTFALADAIRSGRSLADRFKAGSSMVFPGADAGGDWVVQNYEGGSFGANLPLLEATVFSVNVVYAQLILDIGPEGVVELAEDMGINTELLPVPSAVLGSNAVNALGMASGNATLAAGGVHHPPVAITRIVDSEGKTIYKDESEADKVLEPAVSYITTSALEQVLQRGTGTRAQIGRPAAGKTGTAQEYRDAWFAGFTPQLAAAVWVGYPAGEIEMKPFCAVRFQIVDGVEQEVCRETRTITGGGVTGGSFPALIWQAFMLRALEDLPAESFVQPPTGIVVVTIDTRKGGCLASRFTPDEFRQSASFAAGTEPEETCRIKGDATKVPDVFSFPVDDAVRILHDAGFSVRKEEQGSSAYPPGIVIGQSPGGGERAPEGAIVTIFISVRGSGGDGENAIVPNVLGYTRDDAEATLRAQGFVTRIIVQAESAKGQAKKRRGRVWKQSPAGGSEADRGSTVTIWVNPD